MFGSAVGEPPTWCNPTPKSPNPLTGVETGEEGAEGTLGGVVDPVGSPEIPSDTRSTEPVGVEG